MHGRNGCACCRSLLLLMCAVVTILLYGTPLALGNEIAESVDGDMDFDLEEDPFDSAATVRQDPSSVQKQAIMYGRNGTRQRRSSPPPEISMSQSIGEFRIKMKPGWKLSRKDSVADIRDENSLLVESDRLLDLDFEFPEARIEPLFGERNLEKLARLKTRGEELTGRELPDLSLWYKVVPAPELSRAPIIHDITVIGNLQDSRGQAKLRRAYEILKRLPGIDSIHATSPMIPSSYSHHENQHYLGPDYWDGLEGDYDTEYIQDQGVICEGTGCTLGGMNVTKAWDAGLMGEDIPIGYMEGAWCLDADGDIDADLDIPGLMKLTTPCPTHGSFLETDFEHVTNNNLRGYWIAGMDLQWHGTNTLGIMAAKKWDAPLPFPDVEMTGISSESTYFLGQLGFSEEWIDILDMLVNDPDGEGAIFLLEWNMWCDPTGASHMECPPEVYPDVHDFIQTAVWNQVVVVSIPGNGIKQNLLDAGVNLDGPQLVVGDGDYDILEMEEAESEAYEFDFADTDIEFTEHETTFPTPMKTLNRASVDFEDSGSLIVTAGFPFDLTLQGMTHPDGTPNVYPNRARDRWSAYGSRVDLNFRDSWNWTTDLEYPVDGDSDSEDSDIEPDTTPYGVWDWFYGTSACGPQATGIAALTQQAYKRVRPGDHLNSIRMRNALVENGNVQVTFSEDPNRTLGVIDDPDETPPISGRLAKELESPHEPFARIGPRPDMGKVLDAFGIVSEYETFNQIRLSFNDHQYRSVDWGGGAYSQSYYPNEPYMNNFVWRYNTAEDDWPVGHIRSPRIDGGHAVYMHATHPPSIGENRFLVMVDDANNSENYLHPTDNGDFTISGWVDIYDIGSYYQGLFVKERISPSWRREYGMYISPLGKLHFHCHSSRDNATRISQFGNRVLDENRLYYVAVTFESGANSTIRFYIDGHEDNWVSVEEPGCMSVDELPWIGYGLRGVIDELYYEDRVVSAAEINARYRQGANPPGLVSEWRFDIKYPEDDEIYDPVSGYYGDLTTASEPSFFSEWGAGYPIGHFGGNSYVTISDPGDSTRPPGELRYLDGEFSVEAHFTLPTSDSTQYLISRGNASGSMSWRIYAGNQALYFKVCTAASCHQAYTSALTTSTSEKARWYHAVFVYDEPNDEMKIYVDGHESQIFATPALTYVPNDALSPIYIGALHATTIGRWTSEIDYIRVYRTALKEDGIYTPFAPVSPDYWSNTGTIAEPRNDIKWLYEHRAAIWQNSYYGWYPENWYSDE